MPTYQRSLSSALHAIQPKEERWRDFTLALILLAVQPETLDYERHAVLRLIIDNSRRHPCPTLGEALTCERTAT